MCPMLENTVFAEGAVSKLCSDENCAYNVSNAGKQYLLKGLSQNYVVIEKLCIYCVQCLKM